MGMSMRFTEGGPAAGSSEPIDFEAVVTKESDDAYRWTLAARKSGSDAPYKPLFMVEYARKPS